MKRTNVRHHIRRTRKGLRPVRQHTRSMNYGSRAINRLLENNENIRVGGVTLHKASKFPYYDKSDKEFQSGVKKAKQVIKQYPELIEDIKLADKNGISKDPTVLEFSNRAVLIPHYLEPGEEYITRKLGEYKPIRRKASVFMKDVSLAEDKIRAEPERIRRIEENFKNRGKYISTLQDLEENKRLKGDELIKGGFANTIDRDTDSIANTAFHEVRHGWQANKSNNFGFDEIMERDDSLSQYPLSEHHKERDARDYASNRIKEIKELKRTGQERGEAGFRELFK